VNLLIAGQRRSRQPGDSAEMVAARRRFLATGAYDRLTIALAHVAGRAALAQDRRPVHVLDVGCGDGAHTRRITASVRGAGLDVVEAGFDVAKPAVAAAARADPGGWYAVASAGDVPLVDGWADVVLVVFGPVVPAELARLTGPGGTVVAAHPGPGHLAALRRLVYAEEAHPHEIKDPLRHSREWFAPAGTVTVSFPITITDAATAGDLFAMTPYRWHAPPDISARLEEAVAEPGGFRTEADIVISSYRRIGP
jgi:23S rRNA (guanine745-N1)-methyltransferase